jgi:hypothetical protein
VRASSVEVLADRPRDDRLQLAYARELPAPVAEVLPRGVSGADRLGDLHGETFVDEELTERGAPSRFPVRVVAAGVADQLAELTPTRRRGVADDVSDLVREPERDKLRVQPEALRLAVGDAREVLQADEGDAAAIDDELAGVRRADAHHEHDVDIDVGIEQRGALLFGRAGEGDDIGALEHRPEVGPVSERGGANDFEKVWAVGIDDVVVPVGFEEAAVGGEVALVGGETIWAAENREEIRQQVNEHQPCGSRVGAPIFFGRGKIVAPRATNKRRRERTCDGAEATGEVPPATRMLGPRRGGGAFGTDFT